MMREEETNDTNFSALMKMSKLEMPFDDFEENVITRIRKEVSYKKGLSLDVKLSFFFFLLGTIAGLLVNLQLQESHSNFLGLSPQNALLIFQLIFVLLFITQLESFVKAILKFRR